NAKQYRSHALVPLGRCWRSTARGHGQNADSQREGISARLIRPTPARGGRSGTCGAQRSLKPMGRHKSTPDARSHVAVREVSEGREGQASFARGGDDPTTAVRPLLDLLECVLGESHGLPDWPAIRCQLAPLVRLAGTDLTPPARRRLHVHLDDVNWHPG